MHKEEMNRELLNRVKVVCNELASLGCMKVEISYYGSGDAGSVDNVIYYDEDDVESDELADTMDNRIFVFCEVEYNIRDTLETLTDLIDGDWYNNEGGQGIIFLNVMEKTIRIDAEYNVMSHETDTQRINL